MFSRKLDNFDASKYLVDDSMYVCFSFDSSLSGSIKDIRALDMEYIYFVSIDIDRLDISIDKVDDNISQDIIE